MTYAFRPMAAEDLPLMRGWLATPAFRDWWGDPDEEIADLAEGLRDPAMAMWIVSFDDRAFAYVQDYDPQAWPGHHFGDLPPGSRGVDLSIGDPDLLGRGHGSALLGQHVKALFAHGAPALGIDPHPDNIRAIRAYQKAGFVAGRIQDTEWGLSLLMHQYRS